jgi:hypothetical protein
MMWLLIHVTNWGLQHCFLLFHKKSDTYSLRNISLRTITASWKTPVCKNITRDYVNVTENGLAWEGLSVSAYILWRSTVKVRNLSSVSLFSGDTSYILRHVMYSLLRKFQKFKPNVCKCEYYDFTTVQHDKYLQTNTLTREYDVRLMALTQINFRIMTAVTVFETESIRPTSIETTHKTIHAKDKHYLQSYVMLVIVLCALPNVRQMSHVYTERTPTDFSVTFACFVFTCYFIPNNMTHGCSWDIDSSCREMYFRFVPYPIPLLSGSDQMILVSRPQKACPKLMVLIWTSTEQSYRLLVLRHITSCNATTSNLHFANSITRVLN